jgi:hypothetical protein
MTFLREMKMTEKRYEDESLYEIILAMPFNWSYKCPCCNEIVTTNQTPKNIKKFYVGRENFNCLNCGIPLIIKNLSEVVACELKTVYLKVTIRKEDSNETS